LRSTPAAVAATCFVLAAATPLVHVPGSLDPARTPTTLSAVPSELPVAIVSAGDPAPDVSWDVPGARPQRLRDLRAHGHVLLVFAPTESQLLALERERDGLLDVRVVPVAVLDRGAAGAADLARRLGLHFVVVPDPWSIVAAQFNVLDPATRRAAPAWFVVDRSGRVRGLDRRGVPDGGYLSIATRTLALASRDAILPGSTRQGLIRP
jgi:peroxiredoxin